jgi:hypothetical protein
LGTLTAEQILNSRSTRVTNSQQGDEKIMTAEPDGARTYSNIKHTILILSGKGGFIVILTHFANA